MLKRLSILLAAFAFSASAQAVLVDFTDASWKTAINNGVTNSNGDVISASIGNVTLSSTGGSLTFNAWDNGGCEDGQPDNSLKCDGDGIGINNDEITELARTNYYGQIAQSITISFAEAVDIANVFLLDLFGTEKTGEIAVIDGEDFHAVLNNKDIGGYFASGYSAEGITSIMLSGNLDCFSDYSLAAIDIEVPVSAVPIPGAAILFGSALLGFFGFKRRRIA